MTFIPIRYSSPKTSLRVSRLGHRHRNRRIDVTPIAFELAIENKRVSLRLIMNYCCTNGRIIFVFHICRDYQNVIAIFIKYSFDEKKKKRIDKFKLFVSLSES